MLRSLRTAQAMWLHFTANPSDSLPGGIAAWLHREAIDTVLEFYGIPKVTDYSITGQTATAGDLRYDLNWDTYIKYDMNPGHILIVEERFKSKGRPFPGGWFLQYKKLINGYSTESSTGSVNREWQPQLQEQSQIPHGEVQPWAWVQGMDSSQGWHQEWNLNDQGVLLNK